MAVDMALDANEIERIYVELLLGLPSAKSLVRSRPEVDQFRKSLAAEIAQMRADGKQFAIPAEFPGVLPIAGTELRYDPSQPRGEDGRWTSGGGGGDLTDDEYNDIYAETESFVQAARMSDAEAGEIAADIRSKDQEFRDPEYVGGTTVMAVTDTDFDEARTSLSEVRKRSIADGWGNSDQAVNGRSFTERALDFQGSSDTVVIVARHGDGEIAGAMGLSIKPVKLNGEPVIGDTGGYLGLPIMGATGVAPGAGSAMFTVALKQAASSRSGIVLEAADEDAAGFWESRGFTPVEGMHVMSAANVTKLAARL